MSYRVLRDNLVGLFHEMLGSADYIILLFFSSLFFFFFEIFSHILLASKLVIKNLLPTWWPFLGGQIFLSLVIFWFSHYHRCTAGSQRHVGLWISPCGSHFGCRIIPGERVYYICPLFWPNAQPPIPTLPSPCWPHPSLCIALCPVSGPFFLPPWLYLQLLLDSSS